MVLGNHFKMTSSSLGPRTGGANPRREVTMAAEKMMVEDVPANVQYDTGAEVCLVSAMMVSRLGLKRQGEPCWMELTSALGGPPVISTRKHRLHFKTGPFSISTVIAYQVDHIGQLPLAHDVHVPEQLFPQAG